MGDYWGLAAYPPSGAWLQELSGRLDGPLRLTTLAELRALGVLGLVRRLWGVRADVGLLLDDGTSGPLVPALLTLLALTRCRRLEAVGAQGSRRAVSRASGLAALARMGWATVQGLLSAWICSRELRALDTPTRLPFPRALRQVAVLRTNLWHGFKAGGSVGHFAGVVNALARGGIRVDVFAPEAPPMVDASVRTHVMPAAAVPAYPYELNYYRYHRRVVREALPVLASLGPDVLYHRLSLGCWAGVSLARRLKIPLVVEYNGSEVWVSRNWGRRLRFEKLAEMGESIGLRAADLVTVVSEPLADEVHARGVPRERIVMHPNGVDAALFDPARFSAADRDRIRGEAGIPRDALLCTFVGTFGRWHGVEVLVSAIQTLAADAAWVQRHQVHFLLLGDGAMMPLARRELGGMPSLVTFAGLRPQHETPAWLAASDILLSPHVPNPDGSRFFGSPTKLFEYMAMARPIVASALEQIADVLQPAYRASDLPIGPSHEEPGARVAVTTTPGSAQEFVAAVRFVADRPDVRAVLGTNARRLALERYTWDANVEALLARCERLSGRQDAQTT